MPTKFNGTVLLWSHGYRISTPIPAALAVPLGLASSTSLPEDLVPGVRRRCSAPTSPTSARARPRCADDQAVIDKLLAQGYALAGVGYSRQGWSTPEAVQANELMIRHINAGAVKGVKKIMVWGESFGGLRRRDRRRAQPGKVAGLLPDVRRPGRAGAGDEHGHDGPVHLEDARRAEPAGGQLHQLRARRCTDLGTVLQTLQGVGNGTVSVSSVGYPVAQANLLGGLMGGLPTVSRGVRRRDPVNPAFATLGTAAALAGGYQPASAGASSAAAMLQNVGAAAALGVMVRYDLEQKARLDGGHPGDRVGELHRQRQRRLHASCSRDEQRGEFGDTLNASTVMPNLLNAMLAKLDSSKGDAASRFPANPKAVKAIRALPAPKGVYTVPTVLISTAEDPIVPAGNTAFYSEQAHGLGQEGRGTTARGGPVLHDARRRTAGRVFAPGAKGPDAAASAAGATPGVGHCNWTLERRPAGRQRGVGPQPDRQQPHAEGRQERQPAHVGHCGRER